MIAQTPSELQSNCVPVGKEFGGEFGGPVSVELLTDPDYRDVIDQMQTNLEATHAVTGTDLETGAAAGRALKALGCAACELDKVCAVRDTLEEKVKVGAKNQEVVEKSRQLAAAPTWLKAARFQASGMTPQELGTLLTDTGSLEAAMADGLLDRIIGNITSEPAQPMTKEALPELRGIGSIPAGTELRTDTIRTQNGKTFTVVDATIGRGSKDDITDESRREYGILCAKFAERLNEIGPDGSPQILSQDQIMQKTIRRDAGSEICEIRMSGKNRLYLSIAKLPGETPDAPIARIVLLGAHGGDASTQRTFIDQKLN